MTTFFCFRHSWKLACSKCSNLCLHRNEIRTQTTLLGRGILLRQLGSILYTQFKQKSVGVTVNFYVNLISHQTKWINEKNIIYILWCIQLISKFENATLYMYWKYLRNTILRIIISYMNSKGMRISITGYEYSD